MRITFILSSLHLSGGVRVVIQYSNRLSKRGHHISLITPKGTVDPDIKAELDSNVEVIQARNTPGSKSNPIWLLRLAWSMAEVVPLSDVIIATHTPTTVVSFLAGKLKKKGKIIWLYMDYPEMFNRRPIEKWLLRNALRWHDFGVTISEACIQELGSYSSGKMSNIGLGLDTTIYHPNPIVKKANYGYSDKKVIFFLGDSRPRKGMADFLAAAEIVSTQVTNLVLWIASKEEINIVTSVAYKLFTRPTDPELANLYSTCDVFVSASWSEGFGLPPLEAMACGAAVVTTDSRGIREFALNGENCLIVPTKNPDRLADAILTLISNPELSDQLRKNGMATASRFDWDIATDRFETALSKI